MENRIALAVGVIVVMVLVSTILLARRMSAKRAFQYRQSGRGKRAG